MSDRLSADPELADLDPDRTGRLPSLEERAAAVAVPLSSESLEEIDAEDILEVDGQSVQPPEPPQDTLVFTRGDGDASHSEALPDRTLRLSRSAVFEAAERIERLEVSIPPAPTTAPVLSASVAPAPQRAQHGSLSPVAFDLSPARSFTIPPPPAVPRFDFVTPVARSSRGLAFGAAAAALVVAGVGVFAGLAIGTRSAGSAGRAAAAAASPERHTAVVVAASSAVISSAPITAPAKDTASATEPATAIASSDVASLPTVTAAPAAPPVHASRGETRETRAIAPAPRATAAAPATTGTILVPASDSLLAIVVDGGYRRVKKGTVVVSCGRHSVRAGTSLAKDVNVPCGGSVSID